MIYIVEDDPNIRDLLVYTLKNTGQDAEGFPSGAEFFAKLSKQLPDLVLLDLMLPGEDGISILKKIRSGADTRTLPVIIITARGSEYDRVTGLDGGADDYITKPFGMMELVARVKAVLRRSADQPRGGILSLGKLSLDTVKHTVSAEGGEVSLTLKEFELLKMLIESGGAVLTRDILLERIWGYGFLGETRTVDVHIQTLRRKLGSCGGFIETVRGVGYRIGEPGADGLPARNGAESE